MNDSEKYMNSIANTFTKAPVFNCPLCNTELHKCFSWDKCQGRALIVNPAVQDSVIIDMLNDPNVKAEEVNEPAEQVAKQAAEESAEVGTIEG